MTLDLNPNLRQVPPPAPADQQNYATPAPAPAKGQDQPLPALGQIVIDHGEQLEVQNKVISLLSDKMLLSNHHQINALEDQIEILQLQIVNLQLGGPINQPQIALLERQIGAIRKQIDALKPVAATPEEAAELAERFQRDPPINAQQVDEIARDRMPLNQPPLVTAKRPNDSFPPPPIVSRLPKMPDSFPPPPIVPQPENPKKPDLVRPGTPLPGYVPLHEPVLRPAINRLPAPIELKRWKRGNQDVVLLLEGNILKYRIWNRTTHRIEKEGNVDVAPLIARGDLTIRRQIDYLKLSHPIIGVAGEIRWGEFDDVPPPLPDNIKLIQDTYYCDDIPSEVVPNLGNAGYSIRGYRDTTSGVWAYAPLADGSLPNADGMQAPGWNKHHIVKYKVGPLTKTHYSSSDSGIDRFIGRFLASYVFCVKDTIKISGQDGIYATAEDRLGKEYILIPANGQLESPGYVPARRLVEDGRSVAEKWVKNGYLTNLEEVQLVCDHKFCFLACKNIPYAKHGFTLHGKIWWPRGNPPFENCTAGLARTANEVEEEIRQYLARR